MNIEELYDKCLNEELIDLTISGKRNKTDENVPAKVKVRPVILKEGMEFQVSEYIGTKVFHKNYKEQELRTVITEYLEQDFKQAQFTMTNATATVLAGKNGNKTVKF